MPFPRCFPGWPRVSPALCVALVALGACTQIDVRQTSGTPVVSALPVAVPLSPTPDYLVVQPRPVVVVQPRPVIVVQPRPVIVVQPRPVIVVQPPPSHWLYPAPEIVVQGDSAQGQWIPVTQ